jgi:DNA-binding beta-propeller fold protein YncE
MTRYRVYLAAGLLLVAGRVAADDAPLALVQTIPLKGVAGKLDHLAVDAKGQRLFVANKPNNTLDIVDLKTGTLVKQIAGQGKASGVAYAPDLDMVYVGNGAGTCNGFAAADYKPVFSTKLPDADNVHYRPATKQVYVAHEESLSVLDGRSGELAASVKLPGSIHGFVIDEAHARAFAVLTKPNVVAVIDLAKNEVTQKYPLTLSDAGSPIAYDAANRLLFVGCPRKKPMVVVFDAETGKEVTAVAIPGGVDDVQFDAERNRLYASCGDNALVVIAKDGAAYRILAQLETPKFSRTSVYNSGKLYLGVPKQADTDGPAVRVYVAK